MSTKGDRQRAMLLPTPGYAQKREGERARDFLIRSYGLSTVMAAETQVCLDIMVKVGIVKPQELIDMIHEICQRAERDRMRQVGIDA